MQRFLLPLFTTILIFVMVSLSPCQTKVITVTESMFDLAHTDVDTLVNVRGKLIQRECDTLCVRNQMRLEINVLTYCNSNYKIKNYETAYPPVFTSELARYCFLLCFKSSGSGLLNCVNTLNGGTNGSGYSCIPGSRSFS